MRHQRATWHRLHLANATETTQSNKSRTLLNRFNAQLRKHNTATSLGLIRSAPRYNVIKYVQT